MTFDPNAAADPNERNIFGLPFTERESRLILIPIPWEVTTSYRDGTAKGPDAILAASQQIDLYDAELGKWYEPGIAMQSIDRTIVKKNSFLRPQAKNIIAKGGEVAGSAGLKAALTAVNKGSRELNTWVYDRVRALRRKKKIVGLVGGEHSTAFGAIEALLEEHPTMGVLQIDAHCDLREAFEGFEHSHASVMYNVITTLPLKKLVQVGIRDFCEAEMKMIRREKRRIRTFFDADLARKKQQGRRWDTIVREIVKTLPKHVFVSFDIDGLEPTLCPHTGTPVPGGLSFHEATSLIRAVAESGRTIVGFDVNEVAPGGSTEWDGNVGGRILLKLCGWTLKSQRLL